MERKEVKEFVMGYYGLSENDEPLEELGGGFFSETYIHPSFPNRAIKASYISDDSGVIYAFWSRDNQHLVGVPKIHDIKQIRINGFESVTIIEMDRYVDTFDERMEKTKHDQVKMYDFCFRFCEQLNEVLKYGKVAKYLIDYIRNISNHNYDPEYLISLTDTTLAVHKFFNGVSDFDLHAGNIMFDVDDNIIIIDPVSFKVPIIYWKH